MNWLSTFILGSLSVAGANSQIVVTESIGYCGVSPSSVSISSSPTSFPATTPAAFLVGFQPSPPTAPQLRRRQALQGYITPDGTLTSDCSASPILAVTPEGELSAAGGEIYSTSQGTAYGPFIASSNPGNISTVWQLSDGTLRFNNASFLNGVASICTNGGSVEAYYLIEPPPTCSPGILTTIAVSACTNLSPSSTPISSNSSANTTTPSSTYAPTNLGSVVSAGPTGTGTIVPPLGNLSTGATPILQVKYKVVR